MVFIYRVEVQAFCVEGVANRKIIVPFLEKPPPQAQGEMDESSRFGLRFLC